MPDGLVVLDNTGTLCHIRNACGSNQRAPLDTLFSVNECQNFMGMGQVRCSRGIVLHLYKHRQTRRYINLDAYANAYRYRPGSQGQPHTYGAIEPHEAKHHVLS